ncbi:Protein KINESIN LIGHT CHAIN-RELATED 1, partial [Sarracenia purpurea var. burkii]
INGAVETVVEEACVVRQSDDELVELFRLQISIRSDLREILSINFPTIIRATDLMPLFSSPPSILAADGKDLATGAAVTIKRAIRARGNCKDRASIATRALLPLFTTQKSRSGMGAVMKNDKATGYLAEAHVQAMQFDEAENLCKKTLEIHRIHSPPASLEEAADRSMVMIANGQENEVAAIDVSIGNIYMSLSRFDEAVFSYQKALTVFKSSKGDNHPSVASVFVRLSDLYYKTGKLRESRSYCENALRIYAKPVPGTTAEEIASGMTEISAIYESFNEPEEALKLLQKAMKLLEDKPGQQSTIAGIEARMGVMFYMIGRYDDARSSFESAVAKLRASGERKSAFFGVLLNQMGLACV